MLYDTETFSIAHDFANTMVIEIKKAFEDPSRGMKREVKKYYDELDFWGIMDKWHRDGKFDEAFEPFVIKWICKHKYMTHRELEDKNQKKLSKWDVVTGGAKRRHG